MKKVSLIFLPAIFIIFMLKAPAVFAAPCGPVMLGVTYFGCGSTSNYFCPYGNQDGIVWSCINNIAWCNYPTTAGIVDNELGYSTCQVASAGPYTESVSATVIYAQPRLQMATGNGRGTNKCYAFPGIDKPVCAGYRYYYKCDAGMHGLSKPSYGQPQISDSFQGWGQRSNTKMFVYDYTSTATTNDLASIRNFPGNAPMQGYYDAPSPGVGAPGVRFMCFDQDPNHFTQYAGGSGVLASATTYAYAMATSGYSPDNGFYVAQCVNNSDCGASGICDRTGRDWTQWHCTTGSSVPGGTCGAGFSCPSNYVCGSPISHICCPQSSPNYCSNINSCLPATQTCINTTTSTCNGIPFTCTAPYVEPLCDTATGQAYCAIPATSNPPVSSTIPNLPPSTLQAPLVPTLYTFYQGYSSQQGYNGWYYVYKATDGTMHLANFGTAQMQPQAWFGSPNNLYWYSANTSSWMMINQDIATGGDGEYALLYWLSPASGSVTVTAAEQRMEGSGKGNGFSFGIGKVPAVGNWATPLASLFVSQSDMGQKSLSFTSNITQGETVYFYKDSNGLVFGDGSRFSLQIAFSPNTTAGTTTSTTPVSGVQNPAPADPGFSTTSGGCPVSNRADGLITSPQFAPGNRFGNTGLCVSGSASKIDNPTINNIRIDSYEALKGLFFIK